MNDRTLALAGIAVAVVLAVLAVHPAAFLGPSDEVTWHETRVDPADAEGYDDRLASIERRGTSEADLQEVRYEALSPEARALFDRTLDEPRTRGSHTYEPTVCHGWVPTCPGLRQGDLPPELAYEEFADPTKAALIVVTDDGRYLFSTPGATPEHHAGAGAFAAVREALVALVVLPLGAFVAAYATGAVARSRSLTAAGVCLAILAVGMVAFSASLVTLAIGATILSVPALIAPATADRRKRAIAVAIGASVAATAVFTSYLVTYTGAPGLKPVGLALAGVLSYGGIFCLSVSSLPDRRTE